MMWSGLIHGQKIATVTVSLNFEAHWTLSHEETESQLVKLHFTSLTIASWPEFIPLQMKYGIFEA